MKWIVGGLFWMLPLLGLALGALSIRLGDWRWAVVGLILFSPPLLYFSASPRFDWATFPLFLYCLAVLSLRFKKPKLARPCLSLAALLTLLLAVLLYIVPVE